MRGMYMEPRPEEKEELRFIPDLISTHLDEYVRYYKGFMGDEYEGDYCLNHMVPGGGLMHFILNEPDDLNGYSAGKAAGILHHAETYLTDKTKQNENRCAANIWSLSRMSYTGMLVLSSELMPVHYQMGETPQVDKAIKSLLGPGETNGGLCIRFVREPRLARPDQYTSFLAAKLMGYDMYENIKIGAFVIINDKGEPTDLAQFILGKPYRT